MAKKGAKSVQCYPLGHGVSYLAPGLTDTWERWGCVCGEKGGGSADYQVHLLHNGIEMVLKRTKWAKAYARESTGEVTG